MKRSIAVLAFVLAFSAAAWAQTVSFVSSNPKPCAGEEFCVDVLIKKDFSNISRIKFPIFWDSTVVEFAGVKDFNVQKLDSTAFDFGKTQNGILFLDWIYSDVCDVNKFITFPDNTLLFRICFRAKGSYGSTSEVKIIFDSKILANGDDNPVMVLKPAGSTNNCTFANVATAILENQTPALVSTCVRPLHLYANAITGNPGDLVCSDISVTGFDGLTALQFSLDYDSTILEYSTLVIPGSLPGLGKDNFATPETSGFKEGSVTLSWAWAVADPNKPSISLPDSTVIFQVCYTVIGDCETNSSISFTSEPTKMEAINVVKDSQYVIPIVIHPGAMQVGDCTPTGLQLFADCGDPVMLNDEVCVGVSAVGLQAVTEMNFLMNFNPKILEFKAINLTSAGKTGIPSISLADFNPLSVSKGFVGFNWKSIGTLTANVADNEPIFEVCFTVTGLGGNAPFTFDPKTAHVFKKPNANVDIGIYPHNCAVTVIQPDGIQIKISDVYGKPGDTVCYDYEVSNFKEITELGFSSVWAGDYLKFIEIKDFALAGLSASNFQISSGDYFDVEWMSGTPITLENGTSIFKVCFEVVGTPPKDLNEIGLTQNCSTDPIGIYGVGTFGDPLALSAASGGKNIGIQQSGGGICVINPTGYQLLVDDAETFKTDSVCVNFRVVDFTGIQTTDFIINWDPTVFTYNSAILSEDLKQKGTMNLNDSGAGVGWVAFGWQTNSSEDAGAELPDSSSLLQVCFVPVGEPGTCIDLEINIENFPSVLKIDGEGSVFPSGGTLCIKDRLVITGFQITEVSCLNREDGNIAIDIEGGSGEYYYSWRDANGTNQYTSTARNLPVGKVYVTIYDQKNLDLSLRDSFDVGIIDNLPFADAGRDTILVCNPFGSNDVVFLQGRAPADPGYQYKWTTIGGQLPGTSDMLRVLASKPGRYVLQVVNKVTQCAAYDTVTVNPPNFPVANAGDDEILSCTSDTLYLDAGYSTPLDSISFLWQGIGGGIVMPGDSAKRNPVVLTAGKYALKVKNIYNFCTSVDTVEVSEPTEIPNANAGADLELGCAGATATLDASASVNLRGVIYTWYDAAGKSVGTGKQVSVDKIGDYVLVVQEEGSGCIERDTVSVIPSPLYPKVSLGLDTLLSCSNPTPVLDAKVSNTSDYTYRWIRSLGGTFTAGGDTILTPTVASGGQFILEVTDKTSLCVTADTILITSDIRRPTAEAGTSGILSCRDPKYTLKGLASSPNGEFNTKWELKGQLLAADSLNLSVASPGTYYFTVTDKRNGCFAIDSAIVTSIIDTPKVVINTVNATITCGVRQITLQTAVTPTRPDYTISWTTTNGAIAGGATTPTPTITAPGVYQVSATNPSNGCQGQANVPVLADTVKPVANAGSDLVISCSVQNVTLNGSGSASGGKYTYKWSGQNGVPAPTNATSIQASVTNGGMYKLEVTDTVNQCVGSDLVTVTMDTLRPAVVIETPGTLTCTVLDVALDGSKSEKGGTLLAEWTSLNGQPVGTTNNAYVGRATVKGGYQLSVRNTSNGCIGTASVEIQENRVAPEAVVVSSVQLPCQGAVRNLDGIGTSTGAAFSYSWRTISGKGTITDETTLSPKVNTPGLYELKVTNTVNGCTDTASVLVVVDPGLVMAQAGTDLVSCTEDAQLTGNQPTGTTGLWSSKSGATVDAPSQFITEVYGMKAGQNVFVWTLSKAECPNYSADSVVVFRDVAPGANNDELVIEPLARSGFINVAQNDQLTLANGFNIQVIQSPKLGRVDSVRQATVYFGVPPRIYGKDELMYVICSNACPDHCDSALVKVEIKYDPNLPQEPVANAITPNGDGSNDALRFELLENGDPAIFPDNEIIIFNRWRDIVYQAKPYNNDWKGVNAAGKDLPHATYYYILRLDISKGLIIQGDITILK